MRLNIIFICNYYSKWSMYMNWGGGILCSALNLILLSNNGAFFTLSNLHDVSLNLANYEKYHFSGTHSKQCSRDDFLQMVDKISQLDIFAYKRDDITLKTIVHKRSKYIQTDDIVGITTEFWNAILFASSFEKVALFSKTETACDLYMTTCSENFANGYYGLFLKYEDGIATIIYKKVQSTNTFGLGLYIKFIEDDYVNNISKNSIKNTINYVMNTDDFPVENVVYEKK
jgi:hypothetical protein